ncbi:MAG: CPBP family intramembrane metalloprotease [Planctomycetota bacterium]|nr:MAG: CPBP family intramembrane metalloprotease [Planctomycetota bacterium]
MNEITRVNSNTWQSDDAPGDGDSGVSDASAPLGETGAGDSEVRGRVPVVEAPAAVFVPWARPVTWSDGASAPGVWAAFDAVERGFTGEATPDRDPMLLRSQSRLAALADCGVVLLIFLMFEVGFTALIALTKGVSVFEDPSQLKPLLLPMMAARAGFYVAGTALLLVLRRQRPACVGATLQGLPLNTLIGVAGAGAMLGVAVVFGLVSFVLFPEQRDRLDDNTERLKAFVPNLSIGGFALLAMFVSLNEEMLFRGLLMPRLRRLLGSWWAAVLTSTVVFTGLHLFDQEWFVLPMIAVLSVVMSLLTIWRRSLVPAIVMHAGFNFSQFMLLQATTGGA